MNIQAFDFSVNILEALLWQKNDAVKLQALLQQKQDWYNVNYTQFWQDWYTNVFNLQTANDFGLSVWSIILNLPLVIEPVPDPSRKTFGFGPYRKNFNNGNFSDVNSPTRLTTEEKRLLLRLRYWQLVSRGAIPETNQFLSDVFAALGVVYVLDGLNMTITALFKFSPSAKLRQLLKLYDLIPRPSGVGIKYLDMTRKTFGFGPYRKNFNNGNFRGPF